MPNGPVRFPCSEADEGHSRTIGRQSAILAKTLFNNRFSSPSHTEQTRGIRLGGRGFQMIKEGLRNSAGFEVFDSTSRFFLCNAQFVRQETRLLGNADRHTVGVRGLYITPASYRSLGFARRQQGERPSRQGACDGADPNDGPNQKITDFRRRRVLAGRSLLCQSGMN
jgi:hypothetical protein